jgi:hypothetical protein
LCEPSLCDVGPIFIVIISSMVNIIPNQLLSSYTNLVSLVYQWPLGYLGCSRDAFLGLPVEVENKKY